MKFKSKAASEFANPEEAKRFILAITIGVAESILEKIPSLMVKLALTKMQVESLLKSGSSKNAIAEALMSAALAETPSKEPNDNDEPNDDNDDPNDEEPVKKLLS